MPNHVEHDHPDDDQRRSRDSRPSYCIAEDEDAGECDTSRAQAGPGRLNVPEVKPAHDQREQIESHRIPKDDDCARQEPREAADALRADAAITSTMIPIIRRTYALISILSLSPAPGARYCNTPDGDGQTYRA